MWITQTLEISAASSSCLHCINVQKVFTGNSFINQFSDGSISHFGLGAKQEVHLDEKLLGLYCPGQSGYGFNRLSSVLHLGLPSQCTINV